MWEKVLFAARAFVEQELTEVSQTPGLGSPIEATLLSAIWFDLRIRHVNFSPNICSAHNTTKAMAAIEAAAKVEPSYARRMLLITPQFEVGGFRVDFLIQFFSKRNQWERLVVECDGHDFHERTKRQAARDRARDRHMQAAGLTVFRFTGSEIFEAPVKCVEQVYQWLRSKQL